MLILNVDLDLNEEKISQYGNRKTIFISDKLLEELFVVYKIGSYVKH